MHMKAVIVVMLIFLFIVAGFLASVMSTLKYQKAVKFILHKQLIADQIHVITNVSVERSSRNMEDQQAERRQVLQNACKEIGYGPNRNLNSELLKTLTNVLVIPELKLVYCFVPKAGCSSWKTLLLQMTGHLKAKHTAHEAADAVFPRLSYFGLAKAREIMSEYKSFVFVRNPFTRILSAYRNKITLEGSDLWRTKLYQWLTKEDPGHAKFYHPWSRNFTFTHFIQWYLSSARKDEHWRELHKLCLPCHMRYDFIGMFSKLKEDSDYLISSLNNTSNIQLPFKQMKTNSSEDTTLRRYYSGLPPKLLRRLIADEGVLTDMALFGFTVPSVITQIINKQDIG